ncbi:MAG: FG-GAP-like repeat-containing protein [Thermodesulfobacteriota bacterium]
MRISLVRRAVFGLACLVLLAGPILAPAAPAQAAAGVSRVIILPFTANAKDDISFLVKGVRDMLASRLAWADRVIVIEPDLVAPAAAKFKPPFNEDKARQLGKELSAQVVVFGSITVLGQAVSVDARVVKSEGGEPLTAFVQTTDQDSVIPRINDFAQRINAEIFERPEAVAAQKKAQDQAKRLMGEKTGEERPINTATDPSSLDALPENISPLNPMFLRTLSGIDSDRYWRSPRINQPVESIAVADIDGDGKNELLMLTTNTLRVYRLAGEHFAMITEFKNGPAGEYLFVDVADIAHRGRPQIFVSNFNNKLASSFVLEWAEGGLKMVSPPQNIFYRVQPDPSGKGQILFGQRTAIDTPFAGPIFYMKWDGKAFVPDKELPYNKFTYIFNFALADLNGSGRPYTVCVGPSYSIRIFNERQEQVWMSAEAYGATGKFIPFQNIAGSGWEEDWWYVPARLVLTDLDGDGRQEVVLVRNRDRADGILEKMRMFYQGTIYGLYWNGLSLIEYWRTPNISGYLPDYTLADVGNVGRSALVMAVGQRELDGVLSKGTSHVVAFTLKPQRVIPKKSPGL